MSSQKAGCVVAAICLYAAATFIYAPVISDHPYGYDEADYMWAGKRGFWANYTDENGISFIQFVREGLELAHHSGERQSFSDYIRSTGDIDFYRHYHGPMYAYWLGLLHRAGIQRENVFRGSGLLIHFATATLILFGVWTLFPSLPPVAALMACALFVFNRSALTAASGITQHGLFTFFCIASLAACSRFLRDLEPRWFYVTLGLMACALCTVETSVLLLGALVLSMIVEHRRIREKWPPLRALGGFLLRGAGVFLLTMLICWPTGLLKLGIVKGFLSLLYFALSRRTYTAQGPFDLWREKVQASPWEFALLIPGVIAAFALWRRFDRRRELLPWLLFIALFFLVMLKMTLEYTYYYAPLTAAFAVTTGVAIGILWKRWPAAGRIALLFVVVASIAGITTEFRRVMRASKAARPYESVVLRVVDAHPIAEGARLYLPYQLVPMLHYYHPEIKTVGYDFDFPLARLADGIQSSDAAEIMLCETSFCDGLQRETPGFAAQKILLDLPGPTGQLFYLIELRKTSPLSGAQPIVPWSTGPR